MINLLTKQVESDTAFRLWADAMVSQASFQDYGWALECDGLFFTNYGQSACGTIGDQVMLGHDTATGDGTVKIVRPDTAKGDRGKLTTIGKTQDGKLVLLREGWLKKNNVSGKVKADFAALSGLAPVPVLVDGKLSKRKWYVVADLSRSARMIADQTNAFTLGCIRARALTGGGKQAPIEHDAYSLGLDEKGRIITVNRAGGSKRVRMLQGFVFEALRKRLGDRLTKPSANGYAVDGLFAAANILVEIKTGTFARHCYEAVGQLRLYPSLIGLRPGLDSVLLVPNDPPIRPIMAQALHDARIEVHTYAVGEAGDRPKIRFSTAFLARCKGEHSAR